MNAMKGDKLPTIGKGGSLTKADFTRKITEELAVRTGNSDAKGLASQQLHNRRLIAEKEILAIADRDGLSVQNATKKYFNDVEPLRNSSGQRRSVPALSIAAGIGLPAAVAARLSQMQGGESDSVKMGRLLSTQSLEY
jgi:hypothetical protein